MVKWLCRYGSGHGTEKQWFKFWFLTFLYLYFTLVGSVESVSVKCHSNGIQDCCVTPNGQSMHMGSSSVLVLIGSHSLCNSFAVNQFLFFTPNGENSLCYTPKKQWEQYGGKEMFCLFFISKIYSHVTQKWRPKMGMAIPYCLCWKLLHTRLKYSDISNLFAKLQHAKAPES